MDRLWMQHLTFSSTRVKKLDDNVNGMKWNIQWMWMWASRQGDIKLFSSYESFLVWNEFWQVNARLTGKLPEKLFLLFNESLSVKFYLWTRAIIFRKLRYHVKYMLYKRENTMNEFRLFFGRKEESKKRWNLKSCWKVSNFDFYKAQLGFFSKSIEEKICLSENRTDFEARNVFIEQFSNTKSFLIKNILTVWLSLI